MKTISIKDSVAPFLSLFTSLGTLTCCALPALLVSIGAGATLAGIVSNVPWLIALSKHKVILFTVAGFLLLISGILQYLNRNAPCPADPKQAKVCTKLRKINKWVYIISVIIYLIGFFFAFLAVHIFY